MQPVTEQVTDTYMEVLVHDDYINIAGVQIMSVEYAKLVLEDYVDRPLHVRGHLCATSDNLYRVLRHVFKTNYRKPLISTWGHDDYARCTPVTSGGTGMLIRQDLPGSRDIVV